MCCFRTASHDICRRLQGVLLGSFFRRGCALARSSLRIPVVMDQQDVLHFIKLIRGTCISVVRRWEAGSWGCSVRTRRVRRRLIGHMCIYCILLQHPSFWGAASSSFILFGGPRGSTDLETPRGLTCSHHARNPLHCRCDSHEMRFQRTPWLLLGVKMVNTDFVSKQGGKRGIHHWLLSI